MFNVVLTFYQDSAKLSTNYACKVQLIICDCVSIRQIWTGNFDADNQNASFI